MAKKSKKNPPKKIPRKLKVLPAAKKSARQTGKRQPKAQPIGRTLVSAEEKLYMLFKEDYHARQIFEFLRCETVKDLEQFSPEQIVRLLSKPIRATLERVRQKLAEKNRYLLDDAEYVAAWRKDHPAI